MTIHIVEFYHVCWQIEGKLFVIMRCVCVCVCVGERACYGKHVHGVICERHLVLARTALRARLINLTGGHYIS